jgi:hypothetical protein
MTRNITKNNKKENLTYNNVQYLLASRVTINSLKRSFQYKSERADGYKISTGSENLYI